MSKSPLAEAVAAIVEAEVVDIRPGAATLPQSRATLSANSTTDSSLAPSTQSSASVLVSPVRAFDDGCEIVALHNPHCLDETSRERIFAHTFHYTARAFAAAHLRDGDISTMSSENRQDHLNHTFGGRGVIFLLGSSTSICSTEDQKDANSENDQGLRLYAHLNASYMRSKKIDDLGAVVYVHGICCDPNFQGRGFARRIFTEAVRALQPKAKYLALRTMNVAIVKLMASVCKNSVYPVDPFNVEHRPDLPRVADALRDEFQWGPGLQSETLTIPRGYPLSLVPVFKGASRGSELERIVDNMIDRDCGDCLCCITDL